jgi:hypothetical protein
LVLAGVRGGSDQHEVAGGVGGDGAQQVVALCPGCRPPAGAVGDRVVGFVDDHQFGAVVEELVAPAMGFDEIRRHHDVGMAVEERLVEHETAGEPAHG